jgi:Collagen triple helix repeat (20 copies)
LSGKKKNWLIFLGLLVLSGIVFAISRPVNIPITGQLRTSSGDSVSQGYYDMRVVGFDQATGETTISQDFTDVFISDGIYKLPVSLNRFESTQDSYLQVCRSSLPSSTADGIDDSIPFGCKSAVEQKKTFTYAECPQTISIQNQGLISSLISSPSASLSTECTYSAFAENTGEAIPLAISTAKSPSFIAIKGDSGQTGATGVVGPIGQTGPRGEKGEQGLQGEAGPAGAQGKPGTNGSSGSGGSALDDQTLSYSIGTQILSISEGNVVSLSSLLDNTDTLLTLSCSSGQVSGWNGSAWVCANAGVDTDDQTLSLITNSLSIDGGNSVSLAGYLDNTDSQSIALNSNIISISGNASTIDLSAYLDNTDTQDIDLTGNTLSLVSGGSVSLAGYLDNTDNQDLTLSGNTLALTNDGTTINLASYLDNTDSQSLFLTYDTDNGTDPVADNSTDTLSFVSGTGVTITGDGTIDTITIASVLGVSIDSAEIVNESIVSEDIQNGSIANGDLANSSLTVAAGNGLTNGGSVSLGGTVTLDIGAGTGVTVNANDISITDDGLNFAQLSDSLSLDATTTITLGANNLVTNLDSTGDYLLQDNGVTFLNISDVGGYSFILDAADNPTYLITNNGSGDVTTNLAGTGDFIIQDNGTAFLTLSDIGGYALVQWFRRHKY